MIGTHRQGPPIQVRNNSTSDDWHWFGYTDTPDGAQRLVATFNRDVGWTKYRIQPHEERP